MRDEQEHEKPGRKLAETKQQARTHPRSAQDIGQSEAWLFTTLQSIGDAVIVTDASGYVVFMNTMAVQLTGWSAEEGQGRDCRDIFHIVHETTRQMVESTVDKVMRDGCISCLDKHTSLISKAGTEYSIDDSGSPIRDADGTLTGVVLIFRDISERRRAERTAAEQQQILQTLLDHLPVIITFLDKDERCTWANREWTRAMGWSVEEMQDEERRRVFSLGLSVNPVHTQAGVPVSADRPMLGWHEVKTRSKAGQMVTISWAAVRLSDGTSIGVGQDMTPRAPGIEAENSQMAQVEAHNRRLQQAMQETDHRVKNNLQSISALIDIQLMDHADAVPVKELMQVRMHIKTLASIHTMLVRDVKSEGVPDSLSVHDEFETLMPMLQQVVGERRIQWKADDARLPVKQSMSLAVLVNELVSNAVKHGGQKIEMQFAVVAQDLILEVCDDGPGFAETFDPKSSANYGLELVESVGRIDLGGHISYKNRPGGGACVQVTFPHPALQPA